MLQSCIIIVSGVLTSICARKLLSFSRFLSNPDLPGCKKLSCTKIPDAYLADSFKELPSLPGDLIGNRVSNIRFLNATTFNDDH